MSSPPSDRQVDAAHAGPLSAVLAALGSDAQAGLTEEQAVAARAAHGPNRLAEVPPEPLWKKFLGQFKDLVIWILIVAAVLAGALGEWADSLAILAIVLLNGVLGFLQEARAERALAALKELATPMAKVRRGGKLQALPAADLVPGDAIELEAGDHVPADARLLEAFGLRAQEAALTGESAPVDKRPSDELDADTALGDRANMVYLGTMAAAGMARAVVVATGMRTELGGIAKLLAHEEAEPTPLQRRLAELGRMLVGACLAIVALIFVLQLLRGGEVLEVFLLSVSLAVAAVPEGLPAVVTMSLALGLQRMAKRNALIRRLPSVETLGAVTTICSDKTGTLTRNEMTVKALVAGGAWYQASGAGYAPEGLLYRDGTVEADGAPELRTGDELDAHPACTPVRAAADPDLKRLLEIAAYCNHAEAVHEEGRGWTVIGDPTEGALVVAARKGGVDSRELPGRIVDERPFDSDRKLMSVALARADGSTVLLVKGAPEMLLARCARIREGGRERALEEADLAKLRAWNARMADRALRVLAFAYQDDPARGADGFPEEDLTFAGLAGMIDPPREEAKEAVRRCQEAGIRPVMITGDHPATALAIARELGIAGAGGAALTGQDLDGLDEAALAARCAEASVFARVTAEHKLRVVGALKSRGEVVAMTGDGVNDAPAVRRADIGIAMGRTGTDVTKEASDMVLTDDNFASIVNAVEEGRGIFDDIRKFIHYLLSCNTGEVLTMFGAALLGWPAPLAAIQILWMNLVTDGLPALALGMEPPEAGAMKRPPRPPHEPVITWDRGFRMLRHGALIAAVTLAGFWWFHRGDDGNLELARTAAFCIAAFAQLFFALACRSFEDTMPQLGPFTNLPLLGALVISGGLQVAVLAIPFLREHFKVAAPSQEEFATILVLALIPVTAIEVAKLARRMAG